MIKQPESEPNIENVESIGIGFRLDSLPNMDLTFSRTKKWMDPIMLISSITKHQLKTSNVLIRFIVHLGVFRLTFTEKKQTYLFT